MKANAIVTALTMIGALVAANAAAPASAETARPDATRAEPRAEGNRADNAGARTRSFRAAPAGTAEAWTTTTSQDVASPDRGVKPPGENRTE
jgi:hypothetical protein